MPAYIKAPVGFTHNATTSTTEVVAFNADRIYLLIQNLDDAAVYLGFGEDAVLNTGIRLNANGGSYEMSRDLGNLTTSAVNVIHGSSGNKVICGAESSR